MKFLSTLKADSILAGIPALGAYLFGVDYTAILPTLFILMFADFLTGVAAALNRGEHITSYGLTRTMTKILRYCGSLIAVYHLSTLATGDLVPVVQVMANALPFYIALTEFKSIVENASSAGFNIPGVNKLDELLSQKK